MSIRILIAGYVFTLLASMVGCVVIAGTRQANRGMWWTVGALSSVLVSMLLFAGIGVLPSFLTIVMANEGAVLAFVLLHQAVASVLDSRRRHIGLGILLAVAEFGLCIYFSYRHPDIQARVLVRVSAVTIQVGASAMVLFRHRDRALRYATLVVGWVFAAFALFQLSQLAASILWPPSADRLHPAPVQAFFHVFSFMVGMACCFAVVWLALSERRQDLQVMATTDGLSGLMNRAAFDAALARELGRRRSRPLALLLIDLDHFKAVNDEHGHQIGDEVIRRVSRLLQDSVRPMDPVARYGGEEFAVALKGMRFEQAEIVAERLRSLIAAMPGLSPLVAVTASVGIAMRRDTDTVESLFKRSDEALYLSKHLGRNRVSAVEYAFQEP